MFFAYEIVCVFVCVFFLFNYFCYTLDFCVVLMCFSMFISPRIVSTLHMSHERTFVKLFVSVFVCVGFFLLVYGTTTMSELV